MAVSHAHNVLLHADDLVSEKVRQQLEAREQALKQSEEAPAMTAPQAADYKRQLAALMQPGESVTEALRRLRPPPAKGPRKGAHPPQWPPQPDRAHRSMRCCIIASCQSIMYMLLSCSLEQQGQRERVTNVVAVRSMVQLYDQAQSEY